MGSQQIIEESKDMDEKDCNDCMRCKEYPKDHICIPCGHKVLCNNVKCHELCDNKCPLCDKTVIRINRVRNGKEECVKCKDYPADHVCIPCGHRALCNNEGCHDLCNGICPECNHKIDTIQRLKKEKKRHTATII